MRTEDDIRIERLLGDIGARTRSHPDTDVAAVLSSVEQRRRRRRRAARRRGAVSTAACVVVVLGAVTWWRADRPVRIDAADAPATAPTTQPQRPDTGEVTPPAGDVLLKGQVGPTLDVPGDGSTVSVIGAAGDDVWIARTDGVEATDPVPSTVTRVALDGTVGPTTELHGVPLFATAAADRVWIVTEDRVVSATDPARYRLKEVEPSTGTVRSSNALPDGVPFGLWSDDGVPVVRSSAGELVVDPATASVTRRAAPDPDAVVVPWVRSGTSAWSASTMSSVRAVEHHGPDGSRSVLELPGADAPVPAPAWGEGAAATLVHRGDRSDLVELRPPADPSGAPTARTRVTGLPVDAQLVAIAPDRVWLQRDGRIAALPID